MKQTELLLASQFDSIMQFVTLLIVFIFVLAITYGTTKWIGNYQKSRFTGKNIEYIEGMRLSNTKYIQILRIGNEYIAVGVCKDSMTVLTKLNKEDLVFDENEKVAVNQSFGAILEKLRNNKAENKDDPNEKDEENY